MSAPGWRWLRWGAVALACALAGGVALRAALPSLVGWAIRRAVEGATGMPASLGAVHLALWAGEFRIGDLRVRQPRSGVAVAGWDAVRARLRYGPLLRRTVRIEALEVDRPFVALARGDEAAAGDAIPLSVFTRRRSTGPFALDLDLGRFEIHQGRMTLRDPAGPERTVHLEDLAVTLAEIATGPAHTGRQTTLALSLAWEGARLGATGWVKPFAQPPEADLKVGAGNLDIPRMGGLLLPGGGGAALPGWRIAFEGGRAGLTGRVVRGATGHTEIGATLDFQQPALALGDGGDKVSAASLRLVADGFDVEALTLREGRLEVRGLEGNAPRLVGLAGRAAALRAAVGSLDVVGGSARAVQMDVTGLSVAQGADGPRLEGGAVRVTADALESRGRIARGMAVEATDLTVHGIGGADAEAKIGALRAGAEVLDGGERSGRGLNIQAQRLAGTGFGPRALALALRSVEARADGLAPGGLALQGASLSLEGGTASAGTRPLGSLDALRAAAASLDLAARTGAGLRLEADQVAVAELGPQGLSGRVRAIRASAQGADLAARAVRGATLAVEWLAAARAGQAEPFALVRAARAEVTRADLAAPPSASGTPPVEIARIELDAPIVRVRRDAAGIDLARLAEALPGGGAPPAPVGGAGLSPSTLAVTLAQVREGSLRFTDATVSPEASLDLRDVTVNLLNYRPGGGAPATLVVAAQVGQGGSVQVGAQFTPGTFRNANGTAHLESIEVDPARPYLNLPEPLVAVTGRISAEVEARPADPGAAPPARRRGPAPAWKIVGRLEGQDLAARDALGAPLAEVPALHVRDVEVSLPDLAVTAGEVALDRLRLPVERDGHGAVRIAGIPLDVVRPRSTSTNPSGARSSGGQAQAPRLRVRRLSATGTIPLVDRARPYPLETALTELVVELTDVRTSMTRPVGLRVGGRLEEMAFEAVGTARLDPLRGQAHLVLKDLDVVRWADYLPDAIRGRLADLRGAADLDVAFGATLADLIVRGSVEAAPFQLAEPRGDGVVAVERASIALERLRLDPFEVHASAVVLDRPLVNLERRANGEFNIMAVLPPRAPATGAGASPGAAAIRIDRITMKRGVVLLADRTMTPAFVERLRGVEGQIDGLATAGDARATFQLAGRLGDNAELTLRGQGVPRPDRPSLELAGRLGAFNLVSLNPYVRTLTSHRVERGKIDIEVRYRLEGRELEWENRILIDQFGVVEAEEWPDKFTELAGVSLPFAVSLLEDSEGVMELEVPVRGDVMNPQFDFGEVVRTAIANAVVATITAPLRWIARVFDSAGRIENIQVAPILFAPGSVQLDPAAREGVDRLATFLNEAPRVRIQLVGYAEPEQDAKAAQAGSAAPAAGGPGLIRRLIRRLGVGSAAPPAPDLRNLARRRSVAVQEALRQAGIDPARVFLAEPAVEAAAAATERGKPPQGRVEFRVM